MSIFRRIHTFFSGDLSRNVARPYWPKFKATQKIGKHICRIRSFCHRHGMMQCGPVTSTSKSKIAA